MGSLRVGRAPWWLIATFACIAVMTLLVAAALLHWPVAWWISVPLFSLCLLMPLWMAWRYRKFWRR